MQQCREVIKCFRTILLTMNWVLQCHIGAFLLKELSQNLLFRVTPLPFYASDTVNKV
jgi:hypothetical protein